MKSVILSCFVDLKTWGRKLLIQRSLATCGHSEIRTVGMRMCVQRLLSSADLVLLEQLLESVAHPLSAAGAHQGARKLKSCGIEPKHSKVLPLYFMLP